jgi:mxaD protein
MVERRNTIAIDASPEAVWDVLGDLGATNEWLPGIVAARMEGATRICTTADGFDIREEISDYEPTLRRFRYQHLQVPMPVENSAGSFVVEPQENDGSVVVLQSSFEAADSAQEAEVGQMIEGAFQRALESLKRRVEQGVRWDAK